MSQDQYISDSQQRLLALITALAGNEIEGLAPGQLATTLGCTPSAVTRDLANLRHAGWAEQTPGNGRWRLGPAPVQIAMRHMEALRRAELRLGEVRNRFSRGG